MPLITIGNCFRRRTDCKSFSVIEATPPDATEEQLDTLNFTPESFVCCGCIEPSARDPQQDAYRLCFVNAETDSMTDNDEQDLAHLVAVITQAQAALATRRVARGHIDVPKDFDSDLMVSVDTKQRPVGDGS